MENDTATTIIAKLLKLISVGRFNMDAQGAVFMAQTLQEAEAFLVPPGASVQQSLELMNGGDTNVE